MEKHIAFRPRGAPNFCKEIVLRPACNLNLVKTCVFLKNPLASALSVVIADLNAANHAQYKQIDDTK